MQVIENENIYCFDVDETLVTGQSSAGLVVEIVNPYSNKSDFYVVHERHVALMQEMHGRGRFIIVWSAGGVQWARAVVEALELQQFADVIMTKPTGYVDDLPCGHWMANKVYLPQEGFEHVG